MLVYADPWFAGVAISWIVPGLVFLLGTILLTASVLAFARNREPHAKRRFPRLLFLPLAGGLLFAILWVIGTIRLIVGE